MNMRMILLSFWLGLCCAANIPPASISLNGNETIRLDEEDSDTTASTYRKDNKIVGGVSASPGQRADAPWTVSLQHNGIHECGGTLLSTRVVVTAAHCYFSKNNYLGDGYFDVGLGGVDRTSLPQQYEVDRVFYHNDYIPSIGQSVDDIALLILKLEAKLDGYISAARLPKYGEPDSNFVGKDVLISGWGKLKFSDSNIPKNLQIATLEVETQADCDLLWNGDGYDTKKNLCAESPIANFCDGDSGGPAVYDAGSSRILFGILVYGTGDCMSGMPSVFMKVTNYVKWIEENACLGGFCLPL